MRGSERKNLAISRWITVMGSVCRMPCKWEVNVLSQSNVVHSVTSCRVEKVRHLSNFLLFEIIETLFISAFDCPLAVETEDVHTAVVCQHRTSDESSFLFDGVGAVKMRHRPVHVPLFYVDH